MLIATLIFTLATVFIVSSVANAVDKPKVAGIMLSMNYYEKGARILLHELPSGTTGEELIEGFNKGLGVGSIFKDGKSTVKNAYGNPYTVRTVNDSVQLGVVVETQGKKVGELYRLVVLKEEGAVDSCTVGFGRNNKSMVVLESELCEGTFNGEAEEEESIEEVVVEDEAVTSAFTWTVNEDGVSVTVTGYNGSLGTDITIPERLDGKKVTAIGNRALINKGITGVKLPKTLTFIGEYSFRGNEITELIIPDSVVEIGEWAFRLNKINNLDLGKSLQIIGNSSFQENELGSVTIPNSVTKIFN